MTAATKVSRKVSDMALSLDSKIRWRFLKKKKQLGDLLPVSCPPKQTSVPKTGPLCTQVPELSPQRREELPVPPSSSYLSYRSGGSACPPGLLSRGQLRSYTPSRAADLGQMASAGCECSLPPLGGALRSLGIFCWGAGRGTVLLT